MSCNCIKEPISKIRIAILILPILALLFSTESSVATEHQDDGMRFESVPINTFRFLGNALVCRSDSADDDYACFKIGNVKIGDDYKPRNKAWKEIPLKNNGIASVFPIIANDKYEAYWVIGHKNGKVISVQITGNYPRDHLSFSTIKLTDSEETVRKVLGPRYRVKKVESINGVMWDYYPFPITIEFVDKKVYSIRIAISPSN